MPNIANSLYLVARYQLEWREDALPPVGSHDVLLETIAGSISLGTELAQYRGIERASHPIRYPHMTGYENVARVLAVGSEVSRYKVGDTVFSFYGHRTHAMVHESRPIPVPSSISAEVALSAILTCDVAKGIRKMQPFPEAKVLITGAGAIGLFTVVMLKAYGVAYVDVVEPQATRRELAVKLGATHTFSSDDTIPDDYTMGFECSSRQTAFALLQIHMATNSKICILADGNLEPLSLLPAFHSKELKIVASGDGWDYHQHARWYFEYIERAKPPIADVFDLHIERTQLPDTFAQLADGSLSAIKVLVNY